MPKKTLPLVPYLRQSRKKEQSISIESQREAIEQWAKGAGVELAPEVVEQGVSGSKPWRERALGQAIAQVEGGLAGGIVVAFQDRLSRENGLATAEVWEALQKVGARLVAACEGLDTEAGDQEMLFTIKAAIARDQWKRYQKNWAVATEKAVASGKYQGIAPVGFDRLEDGTLQQNGDAPVIRAVFLNRASGRSWANLANDLEATGVKTATGSERWHINSVRSLVSNPIYKGTLRNGFEHHFAEYAIVTPSEWERAQPLPEAAGTRRDHGKWAVLAGLVWCDECGGRLTPNRTTRNGKTYSYYQCRGRHCSAPARAVAEELDEYVVSGALEAFERVVSLGLVKTGHEPDVERITELEQAIETARARERAALLRLDPSVHEDAETLETLARAVEATKEALTNETGAESTVLTPEAWRASWDAWTIEERREALRHILEGVTVSKVGHKLAEGSEWFGPEGPKSEETDALVARTEIHFKYAVWPGPDAGNTTQGKVR